MPPGTDAKDKENQKRVRKTCNFAQLTYRLPNPKKAVSGCGTDISGCPFSSKNRSGLKSNGSG